jgi:hypothetical protein
MSRRFSWSFTAGAVAQCPCSIWQDGTPTGSAESNGPEAQTLGVRFEASSDGYIAGVRFYKEPDNTGAHTGSLWSSTGTLLANGTFSNETASGWQELDFPRPGGDHRGDDVLHQYRASRVHRPGAGVTYNDDGCSSMPAAGGADARLVGAPGQPRAARLYRRMRFIRCFEANLPGLFERGLLNVTTCACIGPEADAVAIIEHLVTPGRRGNAQPLEAG